MYKYWAILGAFLGLVVSGSVYFLFLSGKSVPDSMSDAPDVASEANSNYEAIEKAISNYEATMKADTYGSSTPEGTLQMFIDALRSGDAGLAARYTLLDMKDPDLREKWEVEIEKKKNDDSLDKIIDVLSRAVYDTSSSGGDTAWFSVWNEEGMADYSVLLKFNAYSGVWKIEQM